MIKPDRKIIATAGALALLALGAAGWAWHAFANAGDDAGAEAPTSVTLAISPQDTTLTLTDEQLRSVKVEQVASRTFSNERDAVGNIAFNDEKTVQVFSPYSGRIAQVFAKAGDDVKRGTVLFTVNSSDLVQAEAALVSTAGVRELTTHALERAKQLVEIQGLSQRDYQQAVSDQQAAEAAFNAARNAMRIFEVPEQEIDRIIATRKGDPTLFVRSPVTGKVTARNAAVGLLVQPGSAPAPFAVSDVSTMWMIANVAESDIPLMQQGQEVDVNVMALHGRMFRARITNIGSSVDPGTHRVQVRSEVNDPAHELRAGMLATFKIHVGEVAQAPAVPVEGVTRESDGTMSVWVTADRRSFTRRTIKLGMQQEGYHQVLGGLAAGELVATDGALFLSNTVTTAIR